MQPTIALVVPAYNPLILWDYKLVDKFHEFTGRMPARNFKLYLILDGPGDEVAEENFNFIQLHYPTTVIINNSINKGKGAALREAIAATTEEYIIYTDIDLPYTMESMISIVENLENYDVVFGIKNRHYYKQLPWPRKIISKVLQLIIKILFPRLPVSDTQCGLKGMNAKGKAIFLETKIDRYLFDLEFILNAAKAKLKIKPIPIALRPTIEFGEMDSKILLQEVFNLWKILWRK